MFRDVLAMNATEREQRLERRIIRQRTYHVRHDNGESFEVHGLTLARIRKLIEAECEDRNWLIEDTEWWEVTDGVR